MVAKLVLWCSLVVSVVFAGPLDQLEKECSGPDLEQCLKDKAFDAAQELLQQDTLQVSSDMTLQATSNGTETEGRSNSWMDRLERYVANHDLSMDLLGSRVTLSARALDQGELRLSFGDNEQVEEGRGKKIKKKLKKFKLRKVLIPIAIVLGLKIMSLLPLGLGILGLKTWNALQLGFGAFLVSFGLAIFHLCAKLTGADPLPTIAASSSTGPTGWESRRDYLNQQASGAPNAPNGADLAYRAQRPLINNPGRYGTQ